MDLALDSKKANHLDCINCDIGLQKLRNCGGRYQRPAIIQVNKEIYRECPRSLTFNKRYEGFLVGLYFDCRENKVWPFGNSIMNQTSYCKELFDFLDGIVGEYRIRENEEHLKKMKDTSKK